MASSVWGGLAMAGQWVLPILCVGAAVISFVGRRQRRELFRHVTDGGDAAARIDAMSWQDFERLLGEAFRLQGFRVVETGGAGADGGVDLELTKNGERYLVQAKHWRAKQVQVEVVRDLAGVMPFRRAVGACIVTSGRFTAPAREFASGRGIELVNGSKLTGLLAHARRSIDAKGLRPQGGGNVVRTSTEARDQAPPPRQMHTNNHRVPQCPVCSSAMRLRTAKKGANAGQRFWGCSNYPECRGTRLVES